MKKTKTPPSPLTCDECKTIGSATLYDLDGQMICLRCVPDAMKDSHYPSKFRRFLSSAVTGEIHIIKRRREAIKKRPQ